MKWHPLPHQVTAYGFMVTRQRSCLWASPGLGKTATTLAVLDNWIGEGVAKGVLIIAPLRVCRITWPDQIARWDHSSWMTVADLRTPEGFRAWEEGTADIYLINPEMLPDRMVKGKPRPGLATRLFKGRTSLPVDTLVIDETDTAKSPHGKRFGSLKNYLHHFRNRIGLTGTPTPNRYEEIFAQIKLIDDGERLGKSFYTFRQTWFTSDFMGWVWKLNPGAKEKIQKKLADLCLVLLGDEHLDIPNTRTIDIEVPLTGDAKAQYLKMEKDMLLELEKGEITALSAAALCTKLLQMTGGAVFDGDKAVHEIHELKIEALRKLIKKHPGEPLMVLTAYTHEMDRVLAAIPGSQRFDEGRLAEWRDGRIPVWVCQPQSMSHGIDGIQIGGRIAVWMTLTHSGGRYKQTNARLVRTGQDRETLIYRLIAPNTIDEAVVECLRNKGEEESGLLAAVRALQLLKKI